MRVSFRSEQRPIARLFDITFWGDLPRPVLSLPHVSTDPNRVDAKADVDISGATFDFVRSIRVFEITYHRRRNRDGDCNSWGVVYMGNYGEQGDYNRRRSSISAVPEASDFGISAECSDYWHRSIFVEWRDHEGTYGHEEVHY